MATESESTCHTDYNPTAYFARFIIQFSDKDSDLYQLGCRIAQEAYEAYISQGFLNDMHTALWAGEKQHYSEQIRMGNKLCL